MGLFDFLKSDPSGNWKKADPLELELNLDKHTFCRTRMGQTYDYLAQLGPSEDRKYAIKEMFRYYSLGVEFGGEQGKLEYVSVYFTDPFGEGFQPYSGKIHFRQEAIKLSAETTETAFRTLFGEPFWRDADEDETVLYYEFPGVEWQVEFTKEGTLKMLMIDAPPVLANENNRRSFGIDKPYPY